MFIGGEGMWREHFEKKVLLLGEAYWGEERITNHCIGFGQITATVCGSKNYEVKAGIWHGRLVQLQCSCPYTWRNRKCKHMAALLFQLENWGFLNDR